MREPFERLQIARRKAGYDDATAAAEAFGFNVNTYRSHENGTRGLKPATATRYARAFRCSSSWLLLGEGGEGADDSVNSTADGKITIDPSDLREVLTLLLQAQKVQLAVASALADIVVESLSAPPLKSLDRNVVRTVQVRLELQSPLYERPTHQ